MSRVHKHRTRVALVMIALTIAGCTAPRSVGIYSDHHRDDPTFELRDLRLGDEVEVQTWDDEHYKGIVRSWNERDLSLLCNEQTIHLPIRHIMTISSRDPSIGRTVGAIIVGAGVLFLGFMIAVFRVAGDQQ